MAKINPILCHLLRNHPKKQQINKLLFSSLTHLQMDKTVRSLHLVIRQVDSIKIGIWMLIRLQKYKIVIQEETSLRIEVPEDRVTALKRITIHQILMKDCVNRLKAKVTTKDQNSDLATTRAETRKQNQQYLFLG